MPKHSGPPAGDDLPSPPDERQVEDAQITGQERTEMDLLYRDRMYPDAHALFSFESKPIEEVKDACLVVLDTNQLLLPYTVSSNTLADIGKVYENLISGGRLLVPAQVAREFVDHRFTKVAEAIHALEEYRSRLGNVVRRPDSKHEYPFLKDLPEYNKLKELEKKAQVKSDECRQAYLELNRQIGKLVEKIRGWYLNDPVSSLYRRLFSKEVIVSVDVNREEVLKEHAYRKRNKIAPGFNDERVGDLLIWKTILQLGKREKPLIFVTGEEKNDWVRKSGKIIVGPRYELIDEYRRASQEKCMYVISLAELLRLFGARKESINELQASDSAAAEEKARKSFLASVAPTTTTPFPLPVGSGSFSAEDYQAHFGSQSGSSTTPSGSMFPLSSGAYGPQGADGAPIDAGTSGSQGYSSSPFSSHYPGHSSEYVAPLSIYWDDGTCTPLVFDRGVWKGPSYRVTPQGETIPVPLLEVNERGVCVDGTCYPIDSRSPFLADFIHNGQKI